MSSVKESSVIQENKVKAYASCPVTFVMDNIAGYWKPIILFNLMAGTRRYSEIRRAIPNITEKVLIEQLKSLQADGLINRKSKPVVPPYVTYTLTKKGKELRPVLYEMAKWAVRNGGSLSAQFSKQLKDFPAAASKQQA